jgi:putative inorganic carbon (hco3(-)) transporter
VCLFAFYEEITHDNFILEFTYHDIFRPLYPMDEPAFRGGILRVQSTFAHPIALGCYLSMIFPLLLVEVIKNDRKRERLLFLAVLVLVTITLFLTISRGPWIAVLIQLAVFLIWWGRRNFRGALLAGSVAAALLLLLVVAGMNSDLSGNTMGRMLNPHGITLGKVDLKNIDESSSEFYRFALAKAVVETLQGERWIYGYGPGTFFLADVESTYDGHAHVNIAGDSDYLKLLFEQGILGLTLFVLLLAVIVHECVRVVRDPRCDLKLFALGGFVAILGFIFENTTVSMFSVLPLSLVFWMIVAMVHNCGKIHR